ncbi:MAG TPA: V-type ATP synthase subunit D [Phycisphaerae bacterium]|nr:V-type ATP synthase subunit D [Phycisphaerae bacterium]HOI56546.1 V-type ATP synthase subunit D [Phycisphaerae bacterium]
MAKLEVAPTKSKYLELKRDLATATQGFELLDQKRTILTIELMGHLDRVRKMESELDPLLEKAFATLREAIIESGSDALQRQSLIAAAGHDVEVRSRPLMGIALPSLAVQYSETKPSLGALDSTSRVDDVAKLFAEVLRMVGQLAELQNLVVRLARELRKTQRRTNALEKLFIPSYEETIKYINDTLEERERESVVMMKMVKARLAAGSDR